MSTTVLELIVKQVDTSFVSDWVDDRQLWGERVQLYRDYVDGKHRLEMTQEQADLLMILKDEGERFAINYCRLVMQKKADRLKVVSIKGIAAESEDESEDAAEMTKSASEALTLWSDRFRRKARFDGLQIDTHEDTITSGDCFVMIDPAPLSQDEEFPALIVEAAYNGNDGIIPIYDLTQKKLIAVAKVWESDTAEKTTGEGEKAVTTIITVFRINIYYPDRVEKFVTDDEKLKPFVEGEATGDDAHIFPWVHPATKQPLGIPFVHFKHDGRSGKWNGESGIKAAIPPNDVLNRSAMNMTLMTNLTAAMIRYIIGADTPNEKITPGMWVGIMKDGVPEGMQMPEVGTFDIGSIGPVIEEAEFSIEQISNVTDTPLPGTMGSSVASGESLKQREIGFTAQIEKLQTKWGNNWEDVIDIVYRVTMALGKKKPPKGADGWESIWKPAEIRNDTEVIENALKIAPVVDRRTVLDQIAPVYDDWDAKRIDTILERLAEETASSNGSRPPPPITPGALIPALAELDAITAAAAETGG